MLPALDPARHSAAAVQRLLGLEPLDREGGYFRRVAEAPLPPPSGALPAAFPGERRAYSVAYLLLTPEGFSALHRLEQDELWFFLAGDPLESLRLGPAVAGWVRLGAGAGGEPLPHAIVPAGTWQGTRLVAGGRWALVALVVVPEFTWSDFTLADRAGLTADYPAWADAIVALTRAQPPPGGR